MQQSVDDIDEILAVLTDTLSVKTNGFGYGYILSIFPNGFLDEFNISTEFVINLLLDTLEIDKVNLLRTEESNNHVKIFIKVDEQTKTNLKSLQLS